MGSPIELVLDWGGIGFRRPYRHISRVPQVGSPIGLLESCTMYARLSTSSVPDSSACARARVLACAQVGSPIELLLAPLLKGHIDEADLSSKIARLFEVAGRVAWRVCFVHK